MQRQQEQPAFLPRPGELDGEDFKHGGLHSIGTRSVAVPLDTVAALGEYLALLDITPGQLRALPTFNPAGTESAPPDQVFLVVLTRPFH